MLPRSILFLAVECGWFIKNSHRMSYHKRSEKMQLDTKIVMRQCFEEFHQWEDYALMDEDRFSSLMWLYPNPKGAMVLRRVYTPMATCCSCEKFTRAAHRLTALSSACVQIRWVYVRQDSAGKWWKEGKRAKVTYVREGKRKNAKRTERVVPLVWRETNHTPSMEEFQ